MNDIIVKATPLFEQRAKKLMTQEAVDDLVHYLEQYPEQGKIISGTSGVRKLRWKTGLNDKGKSGGVRVLYHYSKGILVLLITVYSKAEKENISQAERNELKRLVPATVAKYRGEL